MLTARPGKPSSPLGPAGPTGPCKKENDSNSFQWCHHPDQAQQCCCPHTAVTHWRSSRSGEAVVTLGTDTGRTVRRSFWEREQNVSMKSEKNAVMITLTPLGPAGPAREDSADPSAPITIPGSPFSPCTETNTIQHA